MSPEQLERLSDKLGNILESSSEGERRNERGEVRSSSNFKIVALTGRAATE
jgi:hypothetical protein